ncbi:MAG: YggS family pyridoxal phosphate-dependent enzyme [Chloroflexota bacterium]|nr:YggS family pyridoxal phosphate-dependent enzyme [Chloroflexota bacterium]
MERVEEQIQAACAAAGRSRKDVKLVAVTKTFGDLHIQAGLRAGLRRFGENRVQEGVAKIRRLDEPARWHLIGRLQRNKARDAARYFDLVESVDSLRLASAIDRRAEAAGFPILVQVKLSGVDSQGGADARELPELLGAITSETRLQVRGLMTIAPQTEHEPTLRSTFARLRELRDGLASQFPDAPLDELSMGMTSDYSQAILEGSTIVRIGRAIFGSRPQ